MVRQAARQDDRRQDDRQNNRSQLPARVDAFKAGVLTPERRNELARVLPAHVSPDRFERNLTYALMQNPKLLGMEPALVFQEVAKVTALGFLLDPQLGEAYIINAWNGAVRSEVPQARVGFRGLMKLARQSGDVGTIYASEVCQHDEFQETRGDNKRLIHKPDTFGPRGPIIGYYSHVTFASGATDFETMTLEDVHRIRDRSDGWKAFRDNKIQSTPWSTDEVEMAKKTAIRRLCKRLPQSPEMSEALRIEDDAEHSGMRDVTPRTRLIAPSLSEGQRRAALAHQPQETAEVDARPEPEREKVPVEQAQQTDDAPRQERAEQAPPAQQKPAGKSAAAPFDPEKWVEDIRRRYEAARTEEEVKAIWPDHVRPHVDDVLQQDVDDVGRYRDEAMRRVRG